MDITPISAPTKFRYCDTAFVFACIVAVLIPLSIFPTLMSYMHEALDFVVSSRSTVKVFLVAGCVLALFFLRDATRGRRRSFPRARTIFVASLVLLFALNAFSYSHFATRYHVPLTEKSIVFNQREISSTSLAHNHVLKGVFAPFFSWHEGGYFENADVGTAFIGMESPVFFAFCLIVFIIALCSGALAYLALLEAYPLPNKQRILTVVFGVAALGILVRLLDGGAFSDGVLVYAAVLAFLFWGTSKNFSRWAILGASVYMLTLAALALGGFLSDWNEFAQRLLLSLLGGAIFLPALVALRTAGRGRLVVLLTVVAVLSVLLATEENFGSLEYLSMPLHPGTIVATYHTPRGVGYTPLESVGGLTFYSIDTGLPDAPKTIGAVLSAEHLHDNFYPVAVPYETCMPKSPPRALEFTLATPDPLSEFPHPSYISVASFVALGRDAGLERYRVRLLSPACWPRFINVLDELIKSHMREPTIVYAIDPE